jgi:hypothetical protein
MSCVCVHGFQVQPGGGAWRTSAWGASGAAAAGAPSCAERCDPSTRRQVGTHLMVITESRMHRHPSAQELWRQQQQLRHGVQGQEPSGRELVLRVQAAWHLLVVGCSRCLLFTVSLAALR